MGVNIPPKFTQKPSLRQEGSSIVFSCEIEASPKPDFTWYRGDTRLEVNTNRITAKIDQIGNSDKYTLSLIVGNVTPDDSGSYKVEAKNASGQMAANINLNLQAGAAGGKAGAPSFIQKPAIKQVEGGKKILFECKIAADPKPTLTWFREGIQLSEGGRYRYIVTEESAGQYYIALELSSPQGGDGGTYKLNAKNTHGESNANLKLNLDMSKGGGTAPKFTSKPSIRMLGSSVVFEVQLTAVPGPTITWYKGDTAIQEGGRYKLTTQTDGANFTLQMEISSVNPDDGGSYKVSAKNDFGTSNANLNLNLQGAKQDGKAPKFPEKPSIKMVGNKVVMSVVVEAIPEPTATWFKGTSAISAGGNIHIYTEKSKVASQYILILEITDPTAEDKGQYKCTAKNDFGTGNANLNLNIEGLPAAKKSKAVAPVVQGQPNVTIIKGKTMVIRMIIMTSVKPTCVWSFAGKTIRKGGRFFSEVSQQGQDYAIVLEVDETTVKDSGEYKCTIKNDAGEIIKVVPVNIQALLDELKQDEPQEEKDNKKKKPADKKKPAEEEQITANDTNKVESKKVEEDKVKPEDKKKVEAKKKEEEKKKIEEEKLKAEEKKKVEAKKKDDKK